MSTGTSKAEQSSEVKLISDYARTMSRWLLDGAVYLNSR